MNPSSNSKKIVPVVCAILRREDRVLVAKRPMDKLLGGLWEFPGGKVEPDETPEAALHRELMEELGCTLEITSSLPDFPHEYDWCIVQLHPFCARLRDDSPAPHPIEHLELRWVSAAELAALTPEMAPADVPLLEHVETLFRT